MNLFANYKNGHITINSHRFLDACVTDLDDIIDAHKMDSLEILVASISTGKELRIIRKLVYS